MSDHVDCDCPECQFAALQRQVDAVSALPRYEPMVNLYPGGVPGPAYMRPFESGEYVKLADVLTHFSSRSGQADTERP